MTTQEIKEYYEDTFNRKIRDDLILAVKHVTSDKVAIDCGCGAGVDIEYLRINDFVVHAFDIETESINLCSKRFDGDQKVTVTQCGFNDFAYPKSSLVNADASLFFCPKSEFSEVWQKIYSSLPIGGIFCGSFLGPNDTMASNEFNREAYWPDILVFTEQELKSTLSNFEILKFTEHNVSGHTPRGVPHDWHIFSVVAKKS